MNSKVQLRFGGQEESSLYSTKSGATIKESLCKLVKYYLYIMVLWLQALGTRLEELLEESGPTVEEVVAPVTDSETRRALKANDEEEDFLDEGTLT